MSRGRPTASGEARTSPQPFTTYVGSSARFWYIRGSYGEGLESLEAAVDAAGNDAPIRDRARAHLALGYLLLAKGAAYDAEGSMGKARAQALKALDLSREAGDAAGSADALLALAAFEMVDTPPQHARRLLAEEALILAREAGDDRLVARALMERAHAVGAQHGADELNQAATALRDLGSSRLLWRLYNNAAYNAIKSGSHARARPLLAEAIPLARGLGGPRELALLWGNVGLEALFTGDLDRARSAFEAELRLCREHALTEFAGEGLGGLAAVAARQGNPTRAARLLGAANAVGHLADPDVMVQLEQAFFSPARKMLGDEAWRTAETAGTSLQLDKALDMALDEVIVVASPPNAIAP